MLGQSVVHTLTHNNSPKFEKCTPSLQLQTFINYIFRIIIIDRSMSNLIVRQFTEGRFKSILTEYTKIIGHKTPKVLNQVIPDLSNNLLQSTQSFIEAIINLDAEFVESTSTHALQKKLVAQIQQAKKRNVQIKTVPFKNKLNEVLSKQSEQASDLKRFVVSPYVVFGQTMKQRFQDPQPWANRMPFFGTNRFFSPKDFSFNKIINNQIFGFNCHFLNMSQGFRVTDSSSTNDYPPQQLVITFETDSVSHQFFVADFNYVVKHT